MSEPWGWGWSRASENPICRGDDVGVNLRMVQIPGYARQQRTANLLSAAALESDRGERRPRRRRL
jgi:hypothetical protein